MFPSSNPERLSVHLEEGGVLQGVVEQGPSAGRRAVGGHATGLARPSPRTVANLLPPCPMMPCPSVWPARCRAVPHARAAPHVGRAPCRAAPHAMPGTMPGPCLMPGRAPCHVVPRGRPSPMPSYAALAGLDMPAHEMLFGRAPWQPPHPPHPLAPHMHIGCAPWQPSPPHSDATWLCTMAALSPPPPSDATWPCAMAVPLPHSDVIRLCAMAAPLPPSFPLDVIGLCTLMAALPPSPPPPCAPSPPCPLGLLIAASPLALPLRCLLPIV